MAELHRVEINEKAPNEIEPEEAQTDEVTETTEEQQTERPEWLPEKFKSAEDMANAYSELEKKLGMGGAYNAVTLITRTGADPWPRLSKSETAARLALRVAEALGRA